MSYMRGAVFSSLLRTVGERGRGLQLCAAGERECGKKTQLVLLQSIGEALESRGIR